MDDDSVDLAVERLHFELRERAESEQWAAAREDSAFQAEIAEIGLVFRDAEVWPD